MEIPLAKLSLNDLLAQRAALEKQIEQTQRAERSDAIAQVRALMNQYGLTAADLGGKPGAASKHAAKANTGPQTFPTTLKAQKAAKASKAGSAGKKVAAKYRDASTGQTWSGRGLRPNWLKAALATGRALSDFAL